ncbi:META domain-containing protein [uncultured Chryseobacterium sp.]|uniref:META domain-containing protein n=1 Tax=uncultured Chryseobacterium sp. TaxID=259322 RepID=UPI0025D06366|nr:META domain-containing protein [uncultured Chryseobacterium sp.]
MKNIITFFYTLLIIAFTVSCANKPGTKASSDTTTDTDITGKTWRLIEINSQPIMLVNPKANPFFKLNRADMRYTGHGGCNGVGGTFEIKPNVMRIKFNQGMSTMIACDDLATERAFTQALLAADNYSISGNTLTLNKAKMAPLAKFILQH